MSHIAEIDVVVTNLDDLDTACQRLGLELVRGQETYRWFGEFVGDTPLPEGWTEADLPDLGKCEHAIRIPGDERAYEVGVVRRRDGKSGWQLVWDYWQGGHGLIGKIGQEAGLLKQAYATVAAKRVAINQGFAVSEQQRADGTIQLSLRK